MLCLWLGLASSVGADIEESPSTAGQAVQGEQREEDETARSIRRATVYLAEEVSRWKRDNDCYSCHNHGDGARALFQTAAHELPAVGRAIEQTSLWLLRPDDWADPGGDDEFNDPQLSTIQFGQALLEAIRSESLRGEAMQVRGALQRCGTLLASFQKPSGVWEIGPPGTLGSPITYGSDLATVMALRVLRKASPERFGANIQRGQQWLLGREPQNVMTAAALLLGCSDLPAGLRGQSATRILVRRSLELIRQSQYQGGWGPYKSSRPEIFDTALVLLALEPYRGQPGIESLVEAGREFLVAEQRDDGSWPETTRPAGARSYAHRISTTAWALIALAGRPP